MSNQKLTYYTVILFGQTKCYFLLTFICVHIEHRLRLNLLSAGGPEEELRNISFAHRHRDVCVCNSHIA